MKTLISLILPFLLVSQSVLAAVPFKVDSLRSAGNIEVGGSASIGTTAAPNSKAVLDLTSTTKGFLPPRMTEAERDAIASPPTGLLVFNTTTSKLNQYDGVAWGVVAGGAGGRNYIENGDAESGTTGWATYLDAAGTAPVDGTGGTANITFGTTTSSPLAETASFTLAKSAANRQGEGASYDFTIEREDRFKMLQIDYTYEVLSGTFATGDVAVYIYDVTNSRLIQPSAYQVVNVGVSSSAQPLTFQTTDSTSYRLIFHVASTSAVAYTLKIDSIKIAPEVQAQGTPKTNSVSYAPTISNLGTGSTVTNSGFWYQDGDHMHIVMKVTKDASGGSGSSAVSFGIPSGYTIDTTKLPATSLQSLGYATDLSAGTVGSVLYLNSTSVYLYSMTVGAGQWNGSAFTANKQVTLNFKVPIVGWSASQVASTSANTNPVTLRLTSPSAGSFSAVTNVSFSTATVDTHGMLTSADTITVKVPGLYTIGGAFLTNTVTQSTTGAFEVYYRVNGGSSIRIGWVSGNGAAGVNYYTSGSDAVRLSAGDTINIRVTSSATATLNSGHLYLEKIDGPAQITASTVVTARYTTGTAGSYGTGGAVLDFPLKTEDSHNAVTTGASWKFTAPAPGKYRVSIGLSPSGTNGLYAELYKNGSTYARLAQYRSGANPPQLSGGTEITLLTGEYINIVVFSETATTSLATAAHLNYIDITRVGGVH